MKHLRPCRNWRAGVSALLWACMCASHAGASGEALSETPETSFESTPVLADGRVPASDLLIALSQLPPDLTHRREVLNALERAIDRLPDASVRLGWLAPAACDAPLRTSNACLGSAAPRSLDPGVRAAFKAFLAAALQQTSTPAPSDAASVAARAIAVAETQADLAGSALGKNGPGMLCRQSHVVLVGVDTEPGTLRPTEPSLDGTASAPVVHKVAIDGSNTGVGIDDAVQTALAESLGPDSTRTIALAIVPADRGTAARLVAARYNPHGWRGELAIRAVRGAGVDAASAPWGIEASTGMPYTTASLLEERPPDSRIILSSQGEGQRLKGTPWRWTELSQMQRTLLDQDARQGPDGQGEARVNWLRGAHENEQANGGTLRDRHSRQADMLGSVPWIAPGRPATPAAPAEPAMIYTAGNGGMVHAFDGETGQERFAYVPQGAIARIAAISQPQYMHLPTVAASPFTADWFEHGQARRWLFGALGAGGRGYFALDVGSLPAFGAESLAALQVRLDTTGADDPDLGHIFGAPVATPGDPSRSASVMRLNDGRPALVLGNGFGSDSGQAALLIQYLDGARELRKIMAGKPGDNGLGPVRLVDLDGDQKADVAYAGDLNGRLWKFDLQANDPAQWRVAIKGQPMFKAKDEQGRAQPISTAPTTWPHPEGGRMLVFGTGRMLTRSDRGDTSVQTIYGIHDRDDDAPASSGREALRRRELKAVTRQVGASANDSAASPTRGWYIDLPMAGERTLAHPRHFDGQLIDIVSTIPASVPASGALESCVPAYERQFLNTVRALDGEPPRTAIYGTTDEPLNGGRIELSVIPSAIVRSLGRETRINFDGRQDEASRLRLGFTAVRPAWHQLQ